MNEGKLFKFLRGDRYETEILCDSSKHVFQLNRSIVGEFEICTGSSQFM